MNNCGQVYLQLLLQWTFPIHFMLSLPSHILDDQHYSLNKFLVQRSIRSIWTNEDSLASSTLNSIWLTRIFLEVLAQTIWIKQLTMNWKLAMAQTHLRDQPSLYQNPIQNCVRLFSTIVTYIIDNDRRLDEVDISFSNVVHFCSINLLYNLIF